MASPRACGSMIGLCRALAAMALLLALSFPRAAALSTASLTSALCSAGPEGTVGPGCPCDPFAPLSSSGPICGAGYACSVFRNSSARVAAAPSGAPEAGLPGLLFDLRGLGLSGPEAVATLRGMGLSTKDLASGLGVDSKALTAALEGDGSPTDKLAAAAAALGSGKGGNAALAAAATALLGSVQEQGDGAGQEGASSSTASPRVQREVAENDAAALLGALASYASPSPAAGSGFGSGAGSDSDSDPAELASALLAAAAEPGSFLAASGLLPGPASSPSASPSSAPFASPASEGASGRCEACALGQHCPAGTAVPPLEGAALQRAVRDLQCPPGSYCPTPAYALPCPEGSFCPRGAVTPVTCDLRALLAGAPTFPLPSRELDVQTGILLDGSPLAGNMCPAGSAKPLAACAAGHYCPTPGTELVCPAGHYCRAGSAAPARCPALTSCPAGSSGPARSLLGLVMIPSIALAALVAALAVQGLVIRSRQRAAKTYRARERLWRLLVPAFGPHPGGGGGGAARGGAAVASSAGWPRGERRDASSGAKPAPLTAVALASGGLYAAPALLSSEPPSGAASALSAALQPPSRAVPVPAAALAPPIPSLPAHSVGLSGPPPPPSLRGFGLIRPRLSIEFRSLVVELRDGRQLLRGVSGRFRHSRVAAIMGPSGAGKSTLLGALMGGSAVGFARGTRMRGQVLVNGRTLGGGVLSPVRGYVPQEDVVHDDLTVRENLAFSAALRLSADKSDAERQAIVEDAIDALNLRACAHQIVGGDDARGVSGGQRKRVSIGVELVAKPSILFMDEPTSGLDSTGAADVLAALKRAAQRGMNVVAVLHQPRAAIFALFDDLALLAAGGRMAYMGPGDLALPYFEALGFRLPPHENPADFFLDVVSGAVPRDGDPNFHPHALADAWESLGEGWVRGRVVRGRSRPGGAAADAASRWDVALVAPGGAAGAAGAAAPAAPPQTISTQVAFGAPAADAARRFGQGGAADVGGLSRGAWPVAPDRHLGAARGASNEGTPLRPGGESSDASLDAPLNAAQHAPVTSLLDPTHGGPASRLQGEVSLLSTVSSTVGRGDTDDGADGGGGSAAAAAATAAAVAAGDGRAGGKLAGFRAERPSEEASATNLASDSIGSMPDPAREFSRDLPAPGNAARAQAPAFGPAAAFPAAAVLQAPCADFESIPLRRSTPSARMDGEQLSLLLEAFREADVDRRDALTSVQLGKLLRSLGLEPEEEDLAAALEELADPRCGDRIPRAALLSYVLSGGTRGTRATRGLGGVPGSLYGARSRPSKAGQVPSAASVHRVYSIEGYHEKRVTLKGPEPPADPTARLLGGSGDGWGGLAHGATAPPSDAADWLVAGSDHVVRGAALARGPGSEPASTSRGDGAGDGASLPRPGCTRFQALSPDGVAVLAVDPASLRVAGETQRRDTIESLAATHAPAGPRPDGWLPGSRNASRPARIVRRRDSSFSDEDASMDASTSYDDDDDGDDVGFGERGLGGHRRASTWEAGDGAGDGGRARAPHVEDAHLAAYVSSYAFDTVRAYAGGGEDAQRSPARPSGPVPSRLSREAQDAAVGGSPPLACSAAGASSAASSAYEAHSFGADADLKGWTKADLASRSSSALSSSVSSSPAQGCARPSGPVAMMLPLHFAKAHVVADVGASSRDGGKDASVRPFSVDVPAGGEGGRGWGTDGSAAAGSLARASRRTSPLRRVPGKVRQLGMLLHRAVLKTQRGWATRAVDAFLLVFAGVVIGCIHGTDHEIRDVRGRFALVLLAVGIICVCSSLGAFGRDRLVALRERRSGVGPGARWLAVELAALPEALLAPLVFSSVYYSLTVPSLGFVRLYGVCALAAWWAAGVGHLVSVSVAPENALVAAVAVVMVVGGFVNGVSPPYRQLAPLFKHVTTLSYNRWLVEAAAVMEFERLPSWLAPELRTILFTAGHCGLDAYPLPNLDDDANLDAYRGIPLDPDALCRGAIPRAVWLVLAQGLILRLLTLLVSLAFPRGISLEPLCLGVGDAVGGLCRRIRGNRREAGAKRA